MNVNQKKPEFEKMQVREFYRKYAFPNEVCSGCKAKHPIIQVITYCPLEEAVKRGLLDEVLDLKSILIDLRESKDTVSKHVRLSCAYSCERCEYAVMKSLEYLSKYSWVIVDINRGPKNLRPTTSG